MASRPYKTRHYLKKHQDRAAYLNEVLESGELNITPDQKYSPNMIFSIRIKKRINH